MPRIIGVTLSNPIRFRFASYPLADLVVSV